MAGMKNSNGNFLLVRWTHSAMKKIQQKLQGERL